MSEINALALLEASGITVLTGDYRGWTNRMKVAGKTGNEYTVSMRVSDHVWGCSCPGWIFARTCEHLDAMLPTFVAAFPGSRESPPLLKRGGGSPQDKIGATRASGEPQIAPRLPDPPKAQTSTDAELKRRERIRKITSGEIYKKVAPGSADQWARMAAAFMAGDVNFKEDARAYRPAAFAPRSVGSPILATLFLEAMPDDLATLRSAYRRAVMRAFQGADFDDTAPQYVAAFARITTAFEALRNMRGWR